MSVHFSHLSLDLFPAADHAAIAALLQEKAAWLDSPKKGIARYRALFEQVAHLRAEWCDFTGDVVQIGHPEELAANDAHLVYETMRGFMPWRKGPFSVFGVEIDAEWRSERKWKRLVPMLPDLTDKLVADIGCNNGYYMFRMVPHQPKLVVGFEPYVQHCFAFKTLNRLAGRENLQVLPLGVEQLSLFKEGFDVVFLMGILYHRISPLEVLRDVFSAMRPGGVLIVESQGIPGDEPMALFPKERYAKVPGTYFVPTASCLQNWLSRAGFSKVEMFCAHPMSAAEQRRTSWMEFESYGDFIDPNDPNRTVEGYPAPVRIFCRAER